MWSGHQSLLLFYKQLAAVKKDSLFMLLIYLQCVANGMIYVLT